MIPTGIPRTPTSSPMLMQCSARNTIRNVLDLMEHANTARKASYAPYSESTKDSVRKRLYAATLVVSVVPGKGPGRSIPITSQHVHLLSFGLYYRHMPRASQLWSSRIDPYGRRLIC